jgi:hypothetical protein
MDMGAIAGNVYILSSDILVPLILRRQPSPIDTEGMRRLFPVDVLIGVLPDPHGADQSQHIVAGGPEKRRLRHITDPHSPPVIHTTKVADSKFGERLQVVLTSIYEDCGGSRLDAQPKTVAEKSPKSLELIPLSEL